MEKFKGLNKKEKTEESEIVAEEGLSSRKSIFKEEQSDGEKYH